MSSFDICQINVSKLADDTKVPLIQASVPITGPDDYESFGHVASFQALGITALPYAPTDDGHAEGIILRDVGNFTGAIVGARDVRCAGVVNAMQPGDVVLHSCDPNAKAQVRVHANKQIVMITEDSDAKTMLLMLDGKNDSITITAFGGIIEMTPAGINIVAPGGKASILMSEAGDIRIHGKVQIGGVDPSHNVLCGLGAAFTTFKALVVADPNPILAAANAVVAIAALQALITTADKVMAKGA